MVLGSEASAQQSLAGKPTANAAIPYGGTPTLRTVRDLTRPYDRDLYDPFFNTQNPYGVAWSPDGARLAAYIGAGGVVTVWSPGDGRIVRELRRPGAAYSGRSLAFAAGGRQVVTPPASAGSQDVAFSVFDAETGVVVHEAPGPFPGQPRRINTAHIFAASPDASVLAVVHGPASVQPVALYSTRDWSRAAVLAGSATGVSDRATALGFSADGRLLAVGRIDGRVLVYDVAARRLVQTITAFTENLRNGVATVAFSPDAALVAAGAADSAIAEPLPDGRMRAVLLPDPVRVFRVADGARVASHEGAAQPIRSMAWSPDGRFLAFTARDHSLRLWDPLGPAGNGHAVPLRGNANSVASPRMAGGSPCATAAA